MNRQPRYSEGSSRWAEASSTRSVTENDLARAVTGISRQLLETFAFNQVDNLVGDVAHMREYLSNKFPDPIHHPLEAPRGAAPGSSADRDKILAEYKGAIYGRQCLTSQQVILEFLLGKCLEQCRICLDELRKTQSASRLAEDSTSYIVRHGQSRGVNFDVDGVNAESSRLFRRVREDLYELAEELRDLDGSRQLALQFLRSPGTVLPLS